MMTARFILLHCLFFAYISTRVSSTDDLDPSEYILYFRAFEFELNDPTHWNWSSNTNAELPPSKACTKLYPNLCIVIAENTPGFTVEFNGKAYDFLNGDDWTRVDVQYPLDTIERLPVPSRRRRRALYDYNYLYDMYDHYDDNYDNYNYLYDDAYLRPFGLRNGWQRNGGLSSKMFSPGMGQYGVAPMMGMMPGLAKAFYSGGQSKRMGKMFSMLGRMMRGKALFKKRRRKHKNYMEDGGQFGQMGFPSITGNMMGLVRSQHKMPNFMKIPPSIHINADFRRLLHVKSAEQKATKQVQSLVLSQCVMVVGQEKEEAEICAVYNLETRSIALRLFVADHYERKERGIVPMQTDDAAANEKAILKTIYGVWKMRNMAMFEELQERGANRENGKNEVFTRTVAWTDFSQEECNDLILSAIDYQICIKNDSVIYFQTSSPDHDVHHTTVPTMLLSISSDSDWNEVYVYGEKQQKRRYCVFIQIMKICVHVQQDKIQAVFVQILSAS